LNNYFVPKIEVIMKRLLTTIVILIINIQLLSQVENIKIKLTNDNYKDASITFEQLSDFKLKVMVRNIFNEPIPHLKKDDFEIYKNGWKSKVIDFKPISKAEGRKIRVFLCLDNSYSMSGYTDDVQKIIRELLDSFSKSTEIDLLFFTKTNLHVYSKDFENIAYYHFNSVELSIIEKCNLSYSSTISTARTYLNDQIYSAFEIANNTNNQNDDIFYIILSDGKDIGSSVDYEDVLQKYRKGTIYSIDFRNEHNRNDLLARLSDISDGKYYLSTNIKDLSEKFRQIGERIIFSGYEMTYSSYVPPKLFITDIYQFRNNQRFDIDQVNIEEVNSREIFPLLNYIFFEQNLSDINERYNLLNESNSDTFNIEELPPDQMIIYHNILNIIGFRLREFENSKIKLIGCNNNLDFEKNNLQLSLDRAQSIKNYLTKIWRIDENRIILGKRNLPKKYSNNSEDYGREENRRVEIESDDPRILDVVEAYSLTNICVPEAIQLDCDVISDYKIKNWQLDVTQNNKLVYSRSEDNELPQRISWNLGSTLKNKKILNNDFYISLTVENGNNIVSQPINKVLKVNYESKKEKKTLQEGEKFIEKLSLVLFEFNSSNLDKRNSNVLNYVRESLKSESKVIINGYTDDSGEESFNQSLSTKRAKATKDSFIKILKPKTNNIESYGLGETAPLYNNKLPEGRFYNRTCQIVIENTSETAVELQ